MGARSSGSVPLTSTDRSEREAGGDGKTRGGVGVLLGEKLGVG